MDTKQLKTCFVARNKGSLLALAVIYVGVFYILNFTLIQHDFHVVKDELKETVTIEVVKK